ncbi:hypothetical protein L0V05_00635 [Tabrizicola sp. J26]|uniref:sulfotransferase n=1 Tax=Alitabrizicola rongguiensis TaxID=2909234 RepID=UPI001F451550|nr:sulfotransferase [Tabrizicola rongguiensis]MCF1707311.1 hypothetical protein [Tabrizicola rongguiensis]
MVLGSGFGRTGTTALKDALETPGFGPCRQMKEGFANPGTGPARAGACRWRGCRPDGGVRRVCLTGGLA